MCFLCQKACVKLCPGNELFYSIGMLHESNHLGILDPVYKLYFYDNEQVGGVIPGLYIRTETVVSARESIMAFEEEREKFREKMNDTKRKSREEYMNFKTEFFPMNKNETKVQSTQMRDIGMIVSYMSKIDQLLKNLDTKDEQQEN